MQVPGPSRVWPPILARLFGAPMGRPISAQGNALGTGQEQGAALNGRTRPGSVVRPFRAEDPSVQVPRALPWADIARSFGAKRPAYGRQDRGPCSAPSGEPASGLANAGAVRWRKRDPSSGKKGSLCAATWQRSDPATVAACDAATQTGRMGFLPGVSCRPQPGAPGVVPAKSDGPLQACSGTAGGKKFPPVRPFLPAWSPCQAVAPAWPQAARVL